MIGLVNLRDLPPAPRAVATAVTAAVTAASATDAAQLRSAADELAGLDSEQTGKAMGTATRLLLEDLHPDGLDGDDIRSVLEQCTRSAAAWLPEVDPHVLLVVLAGALGIHPSEEDGVIRPSKVELGVHGPVLLADLLAGSGRRLDPYLAKAFLEIARTELMEAP